MHTILRLTMPVVTTAAFASAQTPQHLVVPAAYAMTDAVSLQWIAGASRPLRQMTLVGTTHLTGLVNRAITALELRRTAADETYQGGAAHLTVRLSTAATNPLSCSPTFALNPGGDETLVFDGTVTIPTSPPQLGPVVAWTPTNTVRIAFDVPFVYVGGTLCVDIVGTPIAGQNANWWMADAMFEDLAGTAVELGGGCGGYGGPSGKWSHVATRTLIAGAHADFFAYHTPWAVGVAAFGDGTAGGVPLAWLGFPSPPACELHLASIALIVPVVFEPDPNPLLAGRGGRADVRLPLAHDASFLGLTFTTQWLEVDTWHTSNALTWTTAASVPMLGMALVEGDPSEPAGELSAHLAHVLRFEFL